MQSVLITQHGGEPAKIACSACGSDNLRLTVTLTTTHDIRGLDGHMLRIAGEAVSVDDTTATKEWFTCGACGASNELPAWMEVEASEA